MRVVVVGDVMLDVIAAPRGPIERGADTPATIALLPGGSGANVAAWLGHLGTPVTFAGRAGSDSRELHAAALRAHGVEPVLAADERRRTGVLVSLIADDGERSFLTDRGANAALCPADLPATLLDGAALLHVSGYALENAVSQAALAALLAAAAIRGVSVSVDPGSVSLLRATGTAAFLADTRGAALCFPNAAEAALLAGTADLDAALDALAARYAVVVIKNGATGAMACRAGGAERWTVGVPPGTARDTTGAGDAFVAGYLAAHVAGGTVPDCLQRASAAAAQAIAAFGGRPPARPKPGR